MSVTGEARGILGQTLVCVHLPLRSSGAAREQEEKSKMAPAASLEGEVDNIVNVQYSPTSQYGASGFVTAWGNGIGG